jgi:hypothetical protein
MRMTREFPRPGQSPANFAAQRPYFSKLLRQKIIFHDCHSFLICSRKDVNFFH